MNSKHNMYLKKVLLLVLVTCTVKVDALAWSTMNPPRALPWRVWGEKIINVHFTNMTAEIIKDATLKFKMAKPIQLRYKGSLTYELGLIAASIMGLFERSVEIYREYSNLTTFRGTQQTVESALNAFHIVQSNHNRMRLEQSVFMKIKNDHEEKQQKIIKMFLKKHGRLPSGITQDMVKVPRKVKKGRRMANGIEPEETNNQTDQQDMLKKMRRREEVRKKLFPNDYDGAGKEIPDRMDAEFDNYYYDNQLIPNETRKITDRDRNVLSGNRGEDKDVGLPILVTKRTTKKRLWRPQVED